MSDLAALHAIAQGRVQGVNYRAFVSRNAAASGLTGAVRNLPDNSVEITAEGDKKQLQKFVEAAQTRPVRGQSGQPGNFMERIYRASTRIFP